MYYVTNFNSINDVFDKHRQTFSSARNLEVVNTNQQKTESTYPLTNIGYFPESKYVLIEVSLAGFNKDDLHVRYNGSTICIDAEYTDKNICTCSDCNCEDELKYIQRNIPSKDINRKIYLNNAYIGAKIRSSFVNGILKILVVPTQNYEDITISGTDGEHSHTCERPQQKPKKKHHKPKFPYGFMPVYPIPMVPVNGNNSGNSGHSSDTCNCMDDFVRIDDEDILNIFGSDLTDENDNADIDNTDNNGNSNIPDDNDNTGNNDNSGDNGNQGNNDSSSDDDTEAMSEDDILDILNS